MPIWLQIVLAGLVLVTTTGRRSDVSTAAPSAPQQQKPHRWNRFYAMQTMLISLSRSIESVDTNLGVLVAGGIALFLYVRDHALDAVSKAAAAHIDPPTYMTVFAWLLVAPILLAVIAMVKITPRERPEPTVFLSAFDTDGEDAVDTAIEEMRATYEHNENIRLTKERIQTLVVILFIGVLMLDALWPGVAHAAQAVERSLGLVVES